MTSDIAPSPSASASVRSVGSTHRVGRALPVLAAVSGGALVVDTVTIAVLNRSFDPLDSAIFLVGFVGLILTTLVFSIEMSASRRGAARALLTAACFVGTAGVLGAISAAFDRFGRHAFSPANKGLHGEWSFFSIGVCLLLLAWWSARRLRRTSGDVPALTGTGRR